jgi:hypothetical protein
MEQPERRMPVAGFALLVAGGLATAGYPIAWLLLSPKSVLRSTDPAFVHGFGAGVATAFAVPAGVVMVGFAWSQFARRFTPRNRRRLEIALVAGFIVAVLVINATVRPAQ